MIHINSCYWVAFRKRVGNSLPPLGAIKFVVTLRHGKPLSGEDHKRNKHIAVIRAGGERLFATYKWHYGLARTRFMGLAKNMTVYGLATMAANIRKGAKFLMLYGLPDPEFAGWLRQ